MKFSYVMLPDYPLDRVAALDQARRRARLLCGLRRRRDVAQGSLAAVRRGRRQDQERAVGSERLRGDVLREPTLIAQAAATLDELTRARRGRARQRELRPARPVQHRLDGTKPLSRVKEGVKVVRTFLDDGAITFDGEFFSYSGPVHVRATGAGAVPVKMGAMRGPKSFEARRSSPTAATTPSAIRARRTSTWSSTAGSAPSGRARTSRISTSAPGSCSRSARTRRRRRKPRAAWSGSTPLRCRTSSCGATASTPRSSRPIIAALGAGDLAGRST